MDCYHIIVQRGVTLSSYNYHFLVNKKRYAICETSKKMHNHLYLKVIEDNTSSGLARNNMKLIAGVKQSTVYIGLHSKLIPIKFKEDCISWQMKKK